MEKLDRNGFNIGTEGWRLAHGTIYSRMDQLNIVDDSLCSGRPYHFKFLKAVFHKKVVFRKFLLTYS